MIWCYFRWLKKQGGAHIVNRSWMDALKSVTKLCVKSVSIRRFSGLYFPTFGLNTERYSHVSLHIQSKCWKVLTRKTPNKDKNTFHVVESIQVSIMWIRLIFWIIRNSTTKQSFSHTVPIAAWKVSKHGVISGPYFAVFGLNTEIYGVFGVDLRIRSEYRKIRTTKNSVSGHFQRSVCCPLSHYLVAFLFIKIKGNNLNKQANRLNGSKICRYIGTFSTLSS